MPFDADYLVPIMLDEILPGDDINVRMNALVRLATPIKPVMENQTAATAQDVKLKAAQTEQIAKILPYAIKKAVADGDYAQAEKIMGLIQSGASSAVDISTLGLGKSLKQLFNKKP